MHRNSMLLCGVICLLAVAHGAQTPSGPAYDVISIKPNKSLSHSIHISSHDGTYSASNVTVKMLIVSAYDLKIDGQISGLPGWADSTSFDIEAKEDPADVAAMEKASPLERREQYRALMRNLLAERFHLAIHHETKTLSTYSLVVAKGGKKFKESDPNNPHSGSTSIDNQKMTATGITMEDFCYTFSGQLERQVVNKTGLEGKFDINLVWSREDAPVESKDTAGVDSAPSLFTALQEQLGLKLESAKNPVDTIVVEHLEQPTEN